jgi:hypothetical protein
MIMRFMTNSIGNSAGLQKSLKSNAARFLWVSALLLFVLSANGCIMSSISESSDSSSESSKSSSKSSKSSSDDKKESYIRDIKQYTVAYTRSNSDIKDFAKGLTTISHKHGVTDWESYNATYLGIGEGFAKAAVTQQQLGIYSDYLAAGDQLKFAAIQQGFSQGD